MSQVEVRHGASGALLGGRIQVADRFWTRLRGLLGRPPLEAGQGLMLDPCRSVHMLGMRYPLDVVFLAADDTVVAIYPRLEPGGRTAWHRAARRALELPAGTIEATGTRTGDVLQLIRRTVQERT